ncbi:hypothetical protein B0T19DRAFT_415564 [Cercophora scortea]|uniref:Uncharacterized protein n=1 Tax=Cercophora scortea TaxID=314031 RepID=A0AAE0IWU9_9PEZI|nr:hypothetical protein B0T19DRAFT_415564 [Cercophora scortea]
MIYGRGYRVVTHVDGAHPGRDNDGGSSGSGTSDSADEIADKNRVGAKGSSSSTLPPPGQPRESSHYTSSVYSDNDGDGGPFPKPSRRSSASKAAVQAPETDDPRNRRDSLHLSQCSESVYSSGYFPATPAPTRHHSLSHAPGKASAFPNIPDFPNPPGVPESPDSSKDSHGNSLDDDKPSPPLPHPTSRGSLSKRDSKASFLETPDTSVADTWSPPSLTTLDITETPPKIPHLVFPFAISEHHKIPEPPGVYSSLSNVPDPGPSTQQGNPTNPSTSDPTPTQGETRDGDGMSKSGRSSSDVSPPDSTTPAREEIEGGTSEPAAATRTTSASSQYSQESTQEMNRSENDAPRTTTQNTQAPNPGPTRRETRGHGGAHRATAETLPAACQWPRGNPETKTYIRSPMERFYTWRRTKRRTIIPPEGITDRREIPVKRRFWKPRSVDHGQKQWEKASIRFKNLGERLEKHLERIRSGLKSKPQARSSVTAPPAPATTSAPTTQPAPGKKVVTRRRYGLPGLYSDEVEYAGPAQSSAAPDTQPPESAAVPAAEPAQGHNMSGALPSGSSSTTMPEMPAEPLTPPSPPVAEPQTSPDAGEDVRDGGA